MKGNEVCGHREQRGTGYGGSVSREAAGCRKRGKRGNGSRGERGLRGTGAEGNGVRWVGKPRSGWLPEKGEERGAEGNEV